MQPIHHQYATGIFTASVEECCWLSWGRYLMGLFGFPKQTYELSHCFPYSSLFPELWDLLGFLRNKSELWESGVFLWNTLVWITALIGSKLKLAQKSRLFEIKRILQPVPWIFLTGLWKTPGSEFFLVITGFVAAVFTFASISFWVFWVCPVPEISLLLGEIPSQPFLQIPLYNVSIALSQVKVQYLMIFAKIFLSVPWELSAGRQNYTKLLK